MRCGFVGPIMYIIIEADYFTMPTYHYESS